MAKPSIVTRVGKGSPLSIAEGDSNFTNLRDATFSVLANGVTVSNELNSSFEIEAGTGITVSGNNTTKKITITNSASSGIASVSADSSPVLGGNLDVSTYKIITSGSNRNIELDPHGTGVVAITGPLTVSGNLTVSGTTTTVNSTQVDVADLSITVAKGATNKTAANGAGLTIDLGSDGTASMQYVSATDRVLFDKQVAGTFFSNGASNFSGGTVNLGSNSNVTITGGSSGQVLRTDGSGALTWVNQSSGPSSTSDLTEGTNLYYTDARARSAISASGSLSYNSSTGVISFTETTEIPSQTGNSGKYLTTNGTAVSWGTVSSGIATVSADTTPALGGNLNVGTNVINTTTTNGNIALAPNGTGFVQLGNGSFPGKLTSNGANNLMLSTNNGTDTGTIVINTGLNANIGINPNGTGKIMLNGAVGINATSGTPTTFNTSYFEGTLDTPASWLKLEVGGNNYYLPMFQ